MSRETDDDEVMIAHRCIKKSGMRPMKYYRIYAPDRDTNECCFQCGKGGGKCSWSRDFTPVDGWVAVHHESDGRKPESYKIFWCPEYTEDDEPIRLDNENAEALLAAILSGIADDYRKAMENVSQCRKALHRYGISAKSRAGISEKYSDNLQEIRYCRLLLPDWICERLESEAGYSDDEGMDEAAMKEAMRSRELSESRKREKRQYLR